MDTRKPPDPAAGMAEHLKDATDGADLPSDGHISGVDDIKADPASTNTQLPPRTQTGPQRPYQQGFTGHPYSGQPGQGPGPGQPQDSGQHPSVQGHGQTGQQVPSYPYPGQQGQWPGQGQPYYPHPQGSYPNPQQGGQISYPQTPYYDPRFGYYDYRYGGYVNPQTGAIFQCPAPYGQHQYPHPDGSQQQQHPNLSQHGDETPGQTGQQPAPPRNDQRTQNDPTSTETSQADSPAGRDISPGPHSTGSYSVQPPVYPGQQDGHSYPAYPGFPQYPPEPPPPYNGHQGIMLKLEQDQYDMEKKIAIKDAVSAAEPDRTGTDEGVVTDPAETGDKARNPDRDWSTEGADTTEITPCYKIEVKGLPASLSNDSISLYFENRRRSGGGPVVNVMNREDGTAVVEFARPDAVEGVLKKVTHTISDTHIQVSRYPPEMLQSEVSITCDEAPEPTPDTVVTLYKPKPTTPPPEEEVPLVSPDTIIVTGCGGISDEFLEMYFESRKKSGGGEVKSMERREEDVVLVTFEDPEDAKRVLEKGSHKIEGMDVKVTLYKPKPPTPPPEEEEVPLVSPDTIIVTGCGGFSDEFLEMYFESRKKSGGGEVKSMERIEEGVVLVTFEDPEDVERVLEKGSHKIQRKDVDVSRYKPRPPTPPPVVSPDTIVVTGCKDMSDEFLEMYFESTKKSGGGNVKSIERIDEDVVLVTFEDPEDVEAVLQRSHQIQEVSLQVSQYTLPSRSARHRKRAATEELYLTAEEDDEPDDDVEDDSVFVLLLEGLANTVSEDTLTLYFENRRRSGGGEVDIVEIDRDSATALIYFAEGDAVERVLQKAPHLLDRKKIEVSEYLPSKQPGLVTMDTVLKGKKEGTVLKVEKYGLKTNDEVLTMYFENKKRSGGSEVREIIPDVQENAKYIVFETPEEAKAVVAKRHHTVDGHKLLVSLYRPPTPPPPRPQYHDRFFITGLREKTTKKTLMKFLKHKLACHPKDLVYGEEPGSVLVNIDPQKGPLKLKKMQRVCRKHPLEGAFLELSAVSVSNCIQVCGITARTSTDTLQYYFESKKSGNTIESLVEKVDIVEEPRQAIVFFENHKVIPDILGRSHKLEGVALTVSLYTECLGSGGGHSDPTWFTLPPPVTFQDIDRNKMHFIRDSSPNMKNLRKQLQDGHTDLKFESDGSVTLECCLTKNVPDARSKVKSWKKDATEDLEHFLGLLISEEVNVLQEIWNSVMTEIKGLKMPKPDAATLFVFDESHLIVVVGHKMLAEKLSKQVKEVVASVEGDHERKKKEITETVSSLKSWQLHLLLALGFPGDMMKKYEHLKVEINVTKNVMIITGLMSVVKSAKVDMYEAMQNFKETALSNLSDAQMMLVQKPDVRDYIVKKLKLKHLVGVWEADNGKLKVYGRTDTEVTEVSHIVRQSVVQQVVDLDPESVPLLASPDWKRIYDTQTQNRGDTVKIITAVDESRIVIAAIDELVAEVAEEVNNFITEKTVYSDTVQFPRGIQRFMTMHMDGKITGLSKTFEAHSVEIKFQKSSHDFTVKGTKVGLRICMSKLEELSKIVVHTSNTFRKPGICKLILSDKGDSHIRNIEQNERCVIERNYDDQVQPIYGNKRQQRNMRSSGGGLQTLATCDLGAGRTLYVCQGDITQMKVDVIVNAANQQLAHIGGLAKAIVDKGGHSIQVESDEIRRSQGDIGVGEVAVTKPGNLPCKIVVHAVGPIWSGGRNDEQGLLQEAIFNSLEKADGRRLSSIAIPALSTGIYKYPVAAATKNIIEAIQQHFKDTPRSQVRDVYVCDNKASTVQEFMQAVKQRFGADSVTAGNRGESVEDDRDEDRHVQAKGRRHRQGAQGSFPPDPSPPRGRAAHSMSRIRMSVVPGEIAAEQVDVIVNTTSSSLDLSKGAVSMSILKAGGNMIQQECTAKYPDRIKRGQIAITGAGNLMCQRIFHTCLPSWPHDQNGEMILQTLVANCLKKATEKGYRSIAFPALGTGNLGYPRDVVAKTMMETVEEFGQDNPGTSLQEVKIVVYHNDTPTIKAFEYQKGQAIGGASGHTQRSSRRSQRNFGQMNQTQHRTSAGSTEEDGWQLITTTDLTQVYQLGKVKLTIKQGDLLKEKASCIVNSTNTDLNLKIGAVSQSIMKQGGENLHVELSLKASEMKSKGTVTTTAGGLKADYIIHVSGDYFKHDWKKVISKCLKEAGTLPGVWSIAFPALGTGQGNMTPEQMATCLIEAVKDYQSSPQKHGMISDIRMVIFQKDMLDPFIAGVSKALSTKKKGKLQKIYDFVLGGSDDQTGHVTQPTVQPVNDVTLYFFSDDIKHIEQAKSMLETEYQNNMMTRPISDEALKTLTKQQEANIQDLGSKFGISVDYSRSSGRVRLQGLTNDVIAAMEAVHKIVQDALRQEQLSDKAEMLSSYVQWSYIDVDRAGSHTTVEYEKIINQQIEEAYQSKKSSVSLPPDTNGDIYIVDLTRMEEYNSDYPSDRVSVIRRDLIKGASFEAPANWTTMTKESEMVPVNNPSQEYTDVEQSFVSSLGRYPTILKIERVQTKFLWQQYVAKKQQLEKQNPGHQNETVLWHGTAVDAIPSIYKGGFNRSYCGKNATAVGEGVYFAVQAAYSDRNTYAVPDRQGHKHMFQARVLTGMYCRGQGGMRVPPQRDAANHIQFDSVVDNVSGPGMYIIFNDTQAYPEYLITYA
ncbi:protein mono-ADP-ribosyltransferase PARP14-like isoform X1 [Haliotis rufescens]|uniref:protein mono-ADP-ribosyltransferase PARP14-like isoform X1 n=1 Tax=Haliotis rufescens TaxID=6454 RepID=UPI00201EA517|nr:protein mono-ADP-ribosyltransferase PARP14-like isoform X1 [Haliotis rufescens]